MKYQHYDYLFFNNCIFFIGINGNDQYWLVNNAFLALDQYYLLASEQRLVYFLNEILKTTQILTSSTLIEFKNNRNLP